MDKAGQESLPNDEQHIADFFTRVRERDSQTLPKKAVDHTGTSQVIAFEKARYEHCVQIYQQLRVSRENLDKRAQFYFSIIALIVGASFFKIDSLQGVTDAFNSIPTVSERGVAYYVLILLLALLFFSLLLGLAAIVIAVRLRVQTAPHPRDFIGKLFNDRSYLPVPNEQELYHTISRSYAVAIESHRKNTQKQAKWISYAAYCIIAAVIALTGYMGLVGFLALR